MALLILVAAGYKMKPRFGAPAFLFALLNVCGVLSLSGCDAAFSALEEKYAVEILEGTPIAKGTSLSITGPSFRGAHAYKGTVSISVTPEGIGVSKGSLLTNTILIPTDDIAACAMTCFGTNDRHLDFLIPSKGAVLSFPTSGVLESWCWNNKKQIFPGDAQRGWEYKGKELPLYNPNDLQFSSRPAYDKALFQSCLGY